jgi:aryl-alcohol dehydrogenase-like predicted oxidoreductase
VAHLENGECITAMNLLQKQGKIRFWGLSLPTFEPAPEAEYLMNKNSGSARLDGPSGQGFQLVLNLINQQALQIIKQAGEKGYGVIARMPLQFGLLTGKFNIETNFPANDHRKKRLSKEVIEKSLPALEPIWKLCDKYSITKTQLALSYILSYAQISTVITGIRTPQQVKDNSTGLIKLDAGDMQWIEEYGQHELAELMKLIQAQG